MNPQLKELIDELESALQRARALAASVPADRWLDRPEPDRWSPGECVAHLNLSSIAALPAIREGLARARTSGETATRRYRRDPVGWLIWKSLTPGSRLRVKTAPSFVPVRTGTRDAMMAEFERLHAEQLACVREAEGLPIDRFRIASPIDARVKYNLYSALCVLARHEHRHLLQAERAWEAVSGKTSAMQA